MPIDILMPPLSQTMDSLVLVEWTRQPGQAVAKGEVLFVVETDKATLEVESPATGVLQEILAEPGSEVPVKARIGVLALPGEAVAGAGQSLPADAQAATGVPAPPSGRPPTIGTSGATPTEQALPLDRQRRIFASPRARGLAGREGVALAEVKASGPQGMIVERDVLAYLAQPAARVRVTPLARRRAESSGLDLHKLVPADGVRITRADVESALARPAEAAAGTAVAESGGNMPASPAVPVAQVPAVPPSAGEPSVADASAADASIVRGRGLEPAVRRLRLSTLRKTIARRMQASQQASASVTLTREVDATELKRLRERILGQLSEGDPRPSYTDFLVKIVAHCLAGHPHLNALFVDGETLELYDAVHVAVAVDTEQGLLAPVLRDAGGKGVLDLARARGKLVRRAQDGSLAPEELIGGTFTLSNLGTLGVDAFTPIITPPQTAILGIGRLRTAPAVHDGQITVRELMMLSLTFDHRVVDGAPAARFLADVARLIEAPDLLWL